MREFVLLDSDATYRALLRALVETLGYRGLEAGSREQAMEMLRVGGRGLLLGWDPERPEDLDFVRVVREDARTAGAPVVLMPEHATRAQLIEAMPLGIQGVLLKRQIDVGRLRVALRRGTQGSSASVRRPRPVGTAEPAAEPADGSANGSVADGSVAGSEGAGGEEAGTAAVGAGAGSAGVGVVAGSLRDLHPIHTRAEFLDRLRDIEQTKALPPTLTHLLRILRNPNTTIDQVTSVISQDQSLAVKILKLANSAVYTRGEPVTSVRDAVLRIGLERIQQAVINIGVIDHFGTSSVSEHFNFVHFWEHSICCGLIAAGLGEATGAVGSDEAFTLGLLHDVGRMVLMEHFHEEYDGVLEQAERLDLPLEQVESRMLLLNHGAVAERVLHNWNFPRDLTGPITNHHLSAVNMREHAGKHLQRTAVLALADRLAHALMIGSSGNDVVYPTEALCRLLKVGPKVVAGVLERAEEETGQIKCAVLMMSDQRPWRAVVDRWRGYLSCPVVPLYIGDDEGLDAYRIAIQRLSEPGDGSGPNVAVVRLESKRQVVRLSAALSDRESQLGVGPLPTLILSPAGDVSLDHGQMSRRETACLPTPVTLRRLTGAVSGLVAGRGGAAVQAA